MNSSKPGQKKNSAQEISLSYFISIYALLMYIEFSKGTVVGTQALTYSYTAHTKATTAHETIPRLFRDA